MRFGSVCRSVCCVQVCVLAVCAVCDVCASAVCAVCKCVWCVRGRIDAEWGIAPLRVLSVAG